MAGFSEINKCGGFNKACSWDNFLKKNRKNVMLIRDFRVLLRWSRFFTFWTNYIQNLPKIIFMHEKEFLATIFGMHVALCASVLL